MKKFKLLPVLLLSIITVFSVTGCNEQKVLDSVVESDSKDTQKVLDEYHATCEKYNKYSLRMSDEFVTCLYEQDNEHFDRLYDIQLEMTKSIKGVISKASDLRGIKEYGAVISSSFIQENEKPTYDNGNNKIIFPMNYKIYSTQSEVYDICVKMEVNINNELPKMEELNKDYKFAIECFYNENGERVYTCSPDGENIYAGTLENYEENSSEYALEMPEADPIESQPDGDYDWHDKDSRVVSDTTTEPEANLPVDLKADLAMLRAMGYNPEKTNWGWKCEIYAHLGSKYYTSKATLSYAPITGLWEARWVDGWYENNHGRLAHAGTTLYSDDLINFYDVIPGRGSNRTYTKHFMLTRDGVLAIEF